MFRTALCLLCSVFYLVQAENDTSMQFCSSDYRYVETNKTINITESCNDEKPCIAKCCPRNQIIFSNQCVDVTNLTMTFNRTDLNDYSDVEFYNKNIKKYIIKSSKTMNDFAHIYSPYLSYQSDMNCSMSTTGFLFVPPKYRIYILEFDWVYFQVGPNGTISGSDDGIPGIERIRENSSKINGHLKIRKVNYVNQWISEVPTGEFCVENELVDNGTTLRAAIRLLLIPSNEGPSTKTKISAYAMLVSCFFLLLVLVVYSLLPQLRNLAGMMLMAYVSTLIIGFVFRAVQVLGDEYNVLGVKTCGFVACIMYYGMIGSFTWMNVMSFDIWWSMRGFFKMRQIHRRGIVVKFCWYSLYGWGVPLALLLFIIIVNHIDLTHLPNFITPHLFGSKCAMGEAERQLYMNGPILVATLINIALFLMTAYNIYRIKAGVSKHSAGESRRNKQDEDRFGIYLKLSLVMGIFWILEVVSTSVSVDAWVWLIVDIFNCLIGLFIFLIFLCKRKILVLLCKRFSVGEEFVQKWQPADSTRSYETRLNSLNSKKKMLHSVTESSELEECEKKRGRERA